MNARIAANGIDNEDAEFKSLHRAHWNAFWVVYDATPTGPSEAGAWLDYLREISLKETSEFPFDNERFVTADVAKKVFAATRPVYPQPKKQIGKLSRGKKLTRAGLLYRYHSFLIQELMTLSWEMYGDRDYAHHYHPIDWWVTSRVGAHTSKNKKRAGYWLDGATLPARAKAVLGKLRINTTAPER